MHNKKWPKEFPPLTPIQQEISNDFMQYWHEVLQSKKKFKLIERFNHIYPVKKTNKNFRTTLEIGAGLGEHLTYENLTFEQLQHYVALEMRTNMVEKIRKHHPNLKVHQGDCQETLPFEDNYFDRILAIHVLEHLPNLPVAIREMHRVCNKATGQFIIVIPCEGGLAYSLARKISAQKIFEKRYKQSYKWFVEREHINRPHEIFEELKTFFTISHQSYFPFFVPSVTLNLCIGLTLSPKPEIF